MKKIFKYLGYILLIALAAVIIFFYRMSAIKSDDSILNSINNLGHKFELIHAEYQGVKYRYAVTKNFDQTKPTITLIHGAIGSISTFEKYTKSINSDTANIVIFDRPNYGNDFNDNYDHTIEFEARLTNDLTANFWSEDSNIVLGFSYGGPIALFAHALRPYDSIILVSPAIDPDNEVVPPPIYFYKWKLTRPLVPAVWKEASKEKLSHVKDLNQHIDLWKNITGNIIHIHGTGDIIAPYKNVEFLKRLIDSRYYNHIPIQGGGHGSLWDESEYITDIIIEQLA